MTDKIRKMSSRKIRETLSSEEKVESENNGEENEEGVDYLKSYGKYFKGVWMELYKFNSNNNSNIPVHELGLKVAQLLTFNNELSIVNY